MEILLYFGGPLFAAFFIQLFIGCNTKRKILRYIPLYCFGVTLIFAVVALSTDIGFIVGSNAIAAIVWLVIGVCILFGYGLAFVIFRASRAHRDK